MLFSLNLSYCVALSSFYHPQSTGLSVWCIKRVVSCVGLQHFLALVCFYLSACMCVCFGSAAQRTVMTVEALPFRNVSFKLG